MKQSTQDQLNKLAKQFDMAVTDARNAETLKRRLKLEIREILTNEGLLDEAGKGQAPLADDMQLRTWLQINPLTFNEDEAAADFPIDQYPQLYVPKYKYVQDLLIARGIKTNIMAKYVGGFSIYMKVEPVKKAPTHAPRYYRRRKVA